MNWSKLAGAAGIGGAAEAVRCVLEACWRGRCGIVDNVPSEELFPHMCSPIMEISICYPHDEHFIVGKNADSLGAADMVCGVVLVWLFFFCLCWSCLFFSWGVLGRCGCC